MPLKDPAKKQARDLRNRQRHTERAAGGVCTRCARLPPSLASRYAAVARRKGAPPTRPAVPKPGSKASRTAAAIQGSADVPTAPATGAAARRGWRRGYVHPAVSAGHRTTAPSADHAARPGAHSTAGAMPRAARPAAAYAARSPRSAACRDVADASPWRRSASRPSERAPSARNDMPDGAQEANVWIAERMPGVPHAVPAAHIVPTPARRSVTW